MSCILFVSGSRSYIMYKIVQVKLVYRMSVCGMIVERIAHIHKEE